MEKILILDGKETNYLITSEGKIFNILSGKELKGTTQRNEYRTV